MADVSETAEKTKIPLPVFSGTRDMFAWWLTAIHAFAVTYGFASALKESTASLPEREDTALDTAAVADTALIRGRNKNNLAMSYLVHALKGDILLRFIAGCKTEAWPSGKAHVLMSKLRKKYAPEDLTAVAEFKRELKAIKFGKPMGDPDRMFEKLARIQNKYALTTFDIDWNDVVATVVTVAPVQYHFLLMKYTTGTANTQDTFEELEAEMTNFYRISSAANNDAKNDDDDDDEDKEVGLNQTDFNGECFYCHERGHRIADCPKRKGGGGCDHCGMRSHIEKDCWLKHPHLQPEWYKMKQAAKAEQNADVAATQLDGIADIEVLIA